MKVFKPVIKLVLRENKTLSDGLHPIMLRASFNGMKEISTHYACSKRYWNKKNEMVMRGFPNYQNINSFIWKMKNDAIERANQLMASETLFSVGMIFSPIESNKPNTCEINAFIEHYIESHPLKPYTVKKWMYVKSLIFHYDSSIVDVRQITTDWIKGFCRFMEQRPLTSGVIRGILSKIKALMTFAVNEGIISSNPLNFHYTKMYKTSSNLLYIHRQSVEVMKNVLLNYLINDKGDSYNFKVNSVEELKGRKNLYAGYLWLIGYVFQGMSPVDLSFIETKKVTIKTIINMDFFCYDSHRSKTGHPIHLRIPFNNRFAMILIRFMLLHHNSKWFLPCLDGNDVDDAQALKLRSRNHFARLGKHLKEFFRLVNDEIIRINVENETQIPLIDLECKFLSYRHSFAMHYLNSVGSTPSGLATLMAKSPSTLHQYIIELTSDEDLANAALIV